jgi:hypothetical protein
VVKVKISDQRGWTEQWDYSYMEACHRERVIFWVNLWENYGSLYKIGGLYPYPDCPRTCGSVYYDEEFKHIARELYLCERCAKKAGFLW